MTLEQLKDIIDNEYNLNIAERNRSREHSYARKVYCKLARYKGFTLQSIGESISIKHDAVYYHLRTFQTIENKDLIIYKKVKQYFKKPEVINIKTLHKAEIQKYQKKITDLLIAIDKLKTNTIEKTQTIKEIQDVIDILSGWDIETVTEFKETRLDPFNKSLKHRVKPKTIKEVKGALLNNRVKNPLLC